MRRGAIVTGVLGLGTGLVFAAAALAATLFPTGVTVAAGPSGWWTPDGRAMGRGPVLGSNPVLIDGGMIVIDADAAANGGIDTPQQLPATPAPGAAAIP